MYLDADVDNTDDGGFDQIYLQSFDTNTNHTLHGSTTTVSARDVLTLEASSGLVVSKGSVTIRAGTGDPMGLPNLNIRLVGTL